MFCHASEPFPIDRSFLGSDNGGADRVAGYVYGGTGHIKQPVDSHDEADSFDRQADRGKHHRKGDQPHPGHACCADGSKRRGRNDIFDFSKTAG